MGAVLDLTAIPIDEAAYRLSHNKPEVESALDHALSDGEDFELILAVPPDDAARLIAEQPLGSLAVTDIGEFVTAPGLWGIDADGEREPLEIRGYEHRLNG